LKKIFTIIPYHFYPPQNGGSLRCFYILREMAKENEVYLFTIQALADFNDEMLPAFPKNVTIISIAQAPIYTSIFNIFPNKIANAINHRFLQKKINTSANSFFLKVYSTLLLKVKEIKPTIVYFENLEAVGLFSSLIRKRFPNVKQLYDAHNVDSELWKQMYIKKNDLLFNKYASEALKLEQHLYKLVDYVFCCSENDKEKLSLLNKQQLSINVIPNGVDTIAKSYDKNEQKNESKEILFCGSLDYYPNEEGLLWFYNKILPIVKKEIPTIKFTIVGKVSANENFSKLLTDKEINFEGRVDDITPYYHRASICIAPLLSGSGTRLKILEAMSFGNPVVSTLIGAEGIEYTEDKNIFIADDEVVFANKIIQILNNKNEANDLRLAARDLVVEKYSWEKIGNVINFSLTQL
jgi:polysaccharide biosynthesis protein PslH